MGHDLRSDFRSDLVRPLIPWYAAAAGGLVLCTMRERTITGGLGSQETFAKRLLMLSGRRDILALELA